MENITALGAKFGFGDPLTRGVAGFLIASLTEFLIKPSFSFTPDGKAKTFKETWTPWYIVALIVGIIFSSL